MKLDPQPGLITLEVEVFRRAKSRFVRMAFDTGATSMIPSLQGSRHWNYPGWRIR